jgi:hypothetical protein
MTQYLFPFLIVLMVLSPVLLPAIVTLVHQARIGARAVVAWRRTALEPSLA